MLKSDSDSVFAELAWSPPTCHIEDVLESDTTAACKGQREARGGHPSSSGGRQVEDLHSVCGLIDWRCRCDGGESSHDNQNLNIFAKNKYVNKIILQLKIYVCLRSILTDITSTRVISPWYEKAWQDCSRSTISIILDDLPSVGIHRRYGYCNSPSNNYKIWKLN